MAELYTKTEDGQFKKIGDVDKSQANHIKTDINSDKLKNELLKYWTKKRCGKHNNLAKKHYDVLKNTLTADSTDFFEQVKENHFKFGSGEVKRISSFLKDAKLNDYVSFDYIEGCMNITVPKPAIGKGEFLLVSTYGNLAFSSESGDLIDSDGNRIEFKGKRAPLGGLGNEYKSMAPKVMFSIYKVFDTNQSEFDSLTLEAIDDLKYKMLHNTSRIQDVMMQLQNTQDHDEVLARAMTELFEKTKNLEKTIAAAHLAQYLSIQRADYFFAINSKCYASFKAPRNLDDAYKIIDEHFKVNGWTSGNTGISITLEE